jgi:hypothetical protein
MLSFGLSLPACFPPPPPPVPPANAVAGASTKKRAVTAKAKFRFVNLVMDASLFSETTIAAVQSNSL